MKCHILHWKPGDHCKSGAEQWGQDPVTVDRVHFLVRGHGVALWQFGHDPGMIVSHPDLLEQVDIVVTLSDLLGNGADSGPSVERSQDWDLARDAPDVEVEDPESITMYPPASKNSSN